MSEEDFQVEERGALLFPHQGSIPLSTHYGLASPPSGAFG